MSTYFMIQKILMFYDLFFDTVGVVAPFVRKKILEVINNFTIFTEGEHHNQLQEISTGL